MSYRYRNSSERHTLGNLSFQYAWEYKAPRGWGDIADRFLLEFRGAPPGVRFVFLSPGTVVPSRTKSETETECSDF